MNGCRLDKYICGIRGFFRNLLLHVLFQKTHIKHMAKSQSMARTVQSSPPPPFYLFLLQ